MAYRIAADILVLVHFAFILFVMLGGFLVLWRRWLAGLHLPAVAWGAWVEFTGWICPLTPWEQELRAQAGESGYNGGFVEHYVIALIYPEGLTPTVQTVLGALVLITNLSLYAWVFWRSANP
jgi:hypothetical protein